MKKILIWAIFLSFPLQAVGGVMELSGSFYFSQSKYGDIGLQWTRRWGASVGYYFLAMSELEFAIQDVFYRTKMGIIEDTGLHDRIYSVNWVQSFVPRTFIVQPYVKAGIGQLRREASGSYLGGFAPSSYESVTGVLGAGIRIHLFQNFSVKTEGVTYLTDGSMSTWRDNLSFNAGFSVYF